MTLKNVINAVLGVAFAAFAGSAAADLQFTFALAGFNAGPGPFGTVLLHQVGPAANGQVQVTVSLNQPCCGFVNTGLESLTFNLAPSIPLLNAGSFSNMTAGFAFSPTVPFGGNDGAGTF